MVAGQLLSLALLAVALARIGYREAFSLAGSADDSGFIVTSLRLFNDGGALYDEVFSPYGPGFFVLVGGALELLGVPLTSDGARFVELVLWPGASLLAGVALLRLTRSFVIAASGLLVSFLLLSTVANTPLHPASTIAVLLTAMVAAAAWLLPTRPRAALAALGALAVALTSVKVNVGLLALVAIGFAALVTWPRLRRQRGPRLIGSALLVAIPFLLLARSLDQDWALRYAAVVSLGALAFVLVATRLPPAVVPSERHLPALVAGAGVVLAVVFLVPILGGTSVPGLVEGVVLDPLRLPGIFTIPLALGPLAPLWGVGGVAAALVVRQRIAPGRTPGAAESALLAALRLAAGLAIWISIAVPDARYEIYGAVPVGAGLAWIAAVPPARPLKETSFLRALICGLAILQILHGYPVAGPQLSAGMIVLVIVGGICVGDGVEELSRLGASLRPGFPAWRGVALLGVVAFAAWFCLTPLRRFADSANARYEAGVPLDLPGAERLRLSPVDVEELRDVVADLRANCRTFLSIPGMHSFYLWTEQEPPTGKNGTAWMWLLDSDEQRMIVDDVRGKDGLCVIKNPVLAAIYSLSMGPVPDRPLVRFIDRNFEPAGRHATRPNYYLVEVRKAKRGGAPPPAGSP